MVIERRAPAVLKACVAGAESSGNSPGEDFIELGLLFIVTGLTVVLVVSIVQVLLLRGPEVKPTWVALLVGGAAVGGLGFLAFRLVRRLLWFLKRLR